MINHRIINELRLAVRLELIRKFPSVWEVFLKRDVNKRKANTYHWNIISSGEFTREYIDEINDYIYARYNTGFKYRIRKTSNVTEIIYIDIPEDVILNILTLNKLEGKL